MIGFWRRKKNITLLKATSVAIVHSMLFSFVAIPYAEATLWSERRKSVEEYRSKKREMRRPWKYSAPDSLRASSSGIHIPEEIGRTVDTYWANPRYTGHRSRQPRVIHIQDAHGHAGAQRNLAKILKIIHSANSKNAKSTPGSDPSQPLLVCVEGAWKEVDLEWLHLFPRKTILRSFAQGLLDRGEITGEEYVAMTEGEKTIRVVGVEKERVYWKNVESRNLVEKVQGLILDGRSADGKNRTARVNIKSILDELGGLKSFIYPGKLLDLDSQRNSFEKGGYDEAGYPTVLGESPGLIFPKVVF